MIVHVAAVFALSLVALAAETGNAWHHHPVDPAPPPADAVSRQIWSNRGKFFDHTSGVPYALDDFAAADAYTGGQVMERGWPGDPLPVDHSDAIIIAIFSGFEIQLTPTKHCIYTVVHFELERTLKSSSGPLRPGSTIDVLMHGGTINLKGRVVAHLPNVADDTPLDPGGRYLLFLSMVPGMRGYWIGQHWKLENGQVVAVDLLEVQHARQGLSKFDGHPETEIIAATEEIIRREAVR